MAIERYGVVALVPQPDDWRSVIESESTGVSRIDKIMACRFLVIRRAAGIRAPNTLCFAGGGIEPGETPEEAIIREYREELELDIRIVREIWQSITPWNVHLRWFLAIPVPGSTIHPSPTEVAEVFWCSLNELRNRDDLLVSNIPFFDQIASGKIEL